MATLTWSSQEGPVSFKCDREGFQNSLTLVNFCHRVATWRAAGSPELASQALMAGVHARIQKMEARLEEALTEQTTTFSSAIERLNTSVPLNQGPLLEQQRRPINLGPRAQNTQSHRPLPSPHPYLRLFSRKQSEGAKPRWLPKQTCSQPVLTRLSESQSQTTHLGSERSNVFIGPEM